MADKDKDALSGTETTGHEWDGIKELNTPLPRWWLYTFFVCIVWALIYSVLYPSWPTGLHSYFKGVLGYSSRGALAKDMAKAEAKADVWKSKFKVATIEQIEKDPELNQYARDGGKALFADNCQACHGAGGTGGHGFPALNDDDWLWGGTLKDIEHTITVGIRSTDDDTRSSVMPSFGADQILTPAQISTVADYVLSLSSKHPATEEGKKIFEDNCAACHGPAGHGGRDFGAPNLTDQIWLYGNTKEDIIHQVTKPRLGVMPTWKHRLDPVAIKELTIYVHDQLGGGK